jgi:hypothetical protein
MRKQIIALLVLLVLASFFGAMGYEQQIQRVFPSFNAHLYVSSTIFLMGLSYALAVRNFIIFFLTLAASVAVPWVASWFHVYMPYVLEMMSH